jgi:hypothetical protein
MVNLNKDWVDQNDTTALRHKSKTQARRPIGYLQTARPYRRLLLASAGPSLGHSRRRHLCHLVWGVQDAALYATTEIYLAYCHRLMHIRLFHFEAYTLSLRVRHRRVVDDRPSLWTDVGNILKLC